MSAPSIPRSDTTARAFAAPHESTVRRFLRRHGGQSVAYVILSLMSVVSIFPFIWMVSTSLKGAGQIFAWPPQVIPNPVVWDNYPQVFETLPILRFFGNTVFYTACVTIGQLAFCSLAGFAFARLRFPGRDLIFVLYLATMMIPASVTLVPSFILMRELHWVNTMWAMTVPGMFGSAFGTFLMRQFFLTIPSELDDSATLDGASRFPLPDLLGNRDAARPARPGRPRRIHDHDGLERFRLAPDHAQRSKPLHDHPRTRELPGRHAELHVLGWPDGGLDDGGRPADRDLHLRAALLHGRNRAHRHGWPVAHEAPHNQ